MAQLEAFFKKTLEWWYIGGAIALTLTLGWYAISSIASFASIARSALGTNSTLVPLPATFDFATVDQVLGKPTATP